MARPSTATAANRHATSGAPRGGASAELAVLVTRAGASASTASMRDHSFWNEDCWRILDSRPVPHGATDAPLHLDVRSALGA